MTTPNPPTSLTDYLHLVSTNSDSIHIRWSFRKTFLKNILHSQVYTQRYNSMKLSHGERLSTDTNDYTVSGLTVNTHYKVCLAVFNDNITDPLYRSPDVTCIDAMTTNWHIPISIGSSIGAILALLIVVFIVLLSQCKAKRILGHGLSRRKRQGSSRYDSAQCETSHYDSVFDSSTVQHAECSDVTVQDGESVSYNEPSAVSATSQDYGTSSHNAHPPTQRYLSADYATEQVSPKKPRSAANDRTRGHVLKPKQIIHLQQLGKSITNGTKSQDGINHQPCFRVNTV